LTDEIEKLKADRTQKLGEHFKNNSRLQALLEEKKKMQNRLGRATTNKMLISGESPTQKTARRFMKGVGWVTLTLGVAAIGKEGYEIIVKDEKGNVLRQETVAEAALLDPDFNREFLRSLESSESGGLEEVIEEEEKLPQKSPH